MCPLGMAISPLIFVIASGAQCALWVWRSRLFGVSKQKSEIASQVFLLSRGTICHREVRSDLAFFLCHREALSVIASGTQCALWVWRSRLFGVGGQSKERLLRRLAMTVGVARNETISVVRAGEQKREIASQARNDKLALQQTKERLLRRLAMTVGVARNVAISPFTCWQTEKREIASQARNDNRLRRLATPRGGFDRLALQQTKERLIRGLATPRGGFDKLASQRQKEGAEGRTQHNSWRRRQAF